MGKTLLLLAHPDLNRSVINRALIDSVRDEPSLTIHDLYALYPTVESIDIAEEQRLLLEHDRILIQFPLYWFSTPAIFKEWMDQVLAYGFAYGEGGTKLIGKRCKIILSAGSPETAYTSEGHNRYPVESYLLPLLGSIRYTGMEYDGTFAVFGALGMTPELLTQETQRYRRMLKDEEWI